MVPFKAVCRLMAAISNNGIKGRSIRRNIAIKRDTVKSANGDAKSPAKCLLSTNKTFLSSL